MSTKKVITINTRVDETLHKQMLEKAAIYFNGNLSALIRCASVKYSEASQPTEPNHQLVAVMESAIKVIRRIGINHNQVARNINEKMKLSHLAFTSNDLLPFSQFGDELKTVENMLQYLYNMIKQ